MTNEEIAVKAHELLLQNVDGSLDYVRKKRGFTEYTIHHWQLGYIPNGSDLMDFTWWQRILFPITDNGDTSKIIGFSARKITVDDRPKYRNSANDEVYSKSTSLYGLGYVPAGTDRVFLCEGCPDCLTLWQEKKVYSVASLGKDLTPKQAEILRKRAASVCVAYDADEAGQDGIAKSLLTLRQAGFAPHELFALKIKDAKDVDEALRATCSSTSL